MNSLVNSIGPMRYPLLGMSQYPQKSLKQSERKVTPPPLPINTPKPNQKISAKNDKWKVVTIVCLSTIAIAATAFLAYHAYTNAPPILPSITKFFASDNSLKKMISDLETQILGYKEAGEKAQSTISGLQNQIKEQSNAILGYQTTIQNHQLAEKTASETILRLNNKAEDLTSTVQTLSKELKNSSGSSSSGGSYVKLIAIMVFGFMGLTQMGVIHKKNQIRV